MTLTLASTAFAPDGAIPSRYTCDGEDTSPPLAWHDAPAETPRSNDTMSSAASSTNISRQHDARRVSGTHRAEGHAQI